MSTSSKKPRALSLEALEDRLALSTVVSNGDLVIRGTSADDRVTVSYSNTITGAFCYKVTENGVSHCFAPSQVNGGDVTFYGFAGNDTFVNNTALRTWAYGMDGNDVLVGGLSTDHLYGGNGNDQMWGNGGIDVVDGGAGWDVGHGGPGIGDTAPNCEIWDGIP